MLSYEAYLSAALEPSLSSISGSFCLWLKAWSAKIMCFVAFAAPEDVLFVSWSSLQRKKSPKTYHQVYLFLLVMLHERNIFISPFSDLELKYWNVRQVVCTKFDCNWLLVKLLHWLSDASCIIFNCGADCELCLEIEGLVSLRFHPNGDCVQHRSARWVCIHNGHWRYDYFILMCGGRSWTYSLLWLHGNQRLLWRT